MGDLGSRLREARIKAGLKQKEAALKVGIGNDLLCRYEKGIHSPPYDILVKLANLYGTSVEYLLTGSNGHNQQALWERDEPPSDIELWEFIEKHSNLKLMGYPLDEEAKKDILLALRTALEYIKRERSEKKEKGRHQDGQ